MSRQEKINQIKKHLHGWSKIHLASVEDCAQTGKVSGTLLSALVKMLDEHESEVLQKLGAVTCVNCTKPTTRKHKKEAKDTVFTGFCQHCKHPLFD